MAWTHGFTIIWIAVTQVLSDVRSSEQNYKRSFIHLSNTLGLRMASLHQVVDNIPWFIQHPVHPTPRLFDTFYMERMLHISYATSHCMYTWSSSFFPNAVQLCLDGTPLPIVEEQVTLIEIPKGTCDLGLKLKSPGNDAAKVGWLISLSLSLCVCVCVCVCVTVCVCV